MPDAEIERDGRRPGSTRRVLVVSDQPAQRFVLGESLGRRGYEVFFSGSGVDALEQLDRDPGLSAVVSDLAPAAPGEVPFVPEILRRRRPGLPVVIINGGDTSIMLADSPLVGVLRKPVRVTDVCDLLGQLVEQTAALAPT